MISPGEEILDIFDHDMRWVGTASRADVHREGYWHQTFHCWVCVQVDGVAHLVLQLRHPSKDTNPGKLDVSCAGHLSAGERPDDGTRELREELGLEVEFADLREAGAYREQSSADGVIDNEYCHIYVYHHRDYTSLHGYRPAPDEVSGLYLVPVRTFAQLCKGEIDQAACSGCIYSEDGSPVPSKRDVRLDDLVHRPAGYYELLFNCLKQG
ncbi:NUDIX hydrolase [Alicyclobacillus acidiphilus]|uniref:NUDIX hydrolase n=1 Tax=Alicyclobacillus acidiphilus TaxID=182455 RepID=UPI0009FB4963|nr:NUDIX domain-containing protein [Alicyclobacillus acidiphilus]